MLIDKIGNSYIWQNGEYVKAQNANISVLTHSLHYASSVFEGIRIDNGKIFQLKKHISRLFASARTVGLEIDYSSNQVIVAIGKLVVLNNLSNGYIRPLVWRGAETTRLDGSGTSVNIMVACWEFNRSNKAVNVVMSKWRKPHPLSIPPQCKSSGGYMTMLIALNEAKECGYDDALLLDMNDNIAELTTSNIFFLDGRNLITPTTENVLNGITRQNVIKIAKENNLNVIEKNIKADELVNFDGAFATGTAAGIKIIDSIKVFDKKVVFSGNDNISIIRDCFGDKIRKGDDE